MHTNLLTTSDTKKRVLLTGASGFVGQHLLSLLVDFGYEIHCCQHQSPLILPTGGNIEAHSIDLLDSVAVKRLLKNIEPDYLMHLAGYASVYESFIQPQECFRTNTEITVTLLEAARLTQKQVTFLYVSSAEVYGEAFLSEMPLSESIEAKPVSPYGSSKRAAELMVKQYGTYEGLKTIIARPFNHTGPGQKDSFVIPSFARQIAQLEKKGGGVLSTGNLSAVRDFLHVKDVVSAYLLLLKNSENLSSGSCFNIASGNSVSIKRLLNLLLDSSGADIEVVEDPVRYRPVDIPICRADASRLTSLGWLQSYTHQQLVQDVLEDWRARIV